LHQNIEACFDVFWCLPTSTIPAQPNHRFPQRLQLKVPATFPFRNQRLMSSMSMSKASKDLTQGVACRPNSPWIC
jgi:hypothetical protein